MEKLERTLHYSFLDKQLIETALTHSSFANERGPGVQYNERLEFLGDAVLSIVVSGDNEVQQQEILSCARRCTSGESNAHCYAGSSEDLAEAQALGLPLGKYHAYEELHALDPSITPEEAAGMTMRELRDRIDACQDGDEEESYGGRGGQHQHGGRWNQHE